MGIREENNMSFMTFTFIQVYRAKQYISKQLKNYILSKPYGFS